MANIAIFRINYKSDFILTLNSDAGWLTPFCIKFWTGAPSQAYFVGFDGTTYTHCAPVDGEPTKLRVQFDDHHLPIGDLKFQIAYHFTVDDFPTSVEDEVINQASVIIEVDDAPAQVMLDLNGETAPEIEFSLPAYANEAQRIANEQARIEAEQQRIADEEARIQAEETRQQNEETRIAQEEARVTEFARLKRESEAATGAANDAATLANQKAQLAADKAALAEAAAALANNKAQLAADKAALADAAATLANDKSALAQQKAEYAQTQGDYAKAQGDYAKEQGAIAEEDHARAEQDHDRAESDHAALDNVPESVPSTSPTDLSVNVEDVYLKNRSNNNPQAPRTLARLVTDTAKNRPLNESLTRLAEYQSLGFPAFSASVDYAEGDPCFHDRRLYKAKAGGHSAGVWNSAHFEEFSVKEYVDAQTSVFDVTAKNPTAGPNSDGKFTLEYILSNANTLIPAPFRRGGISISFVQSSDNRYVQYRYMLTDVSTTLTFTTVTNWQGVDEELTPFSKNLVESGVVAGALDKISDVSKIDASDDDDSIVIEDEEGNKVVEITPDGVDAKNLQSNGVDVLTECDLNDIEDEFETKVGKEYLTDIVSKEEIKANEQKEDCLVLATDENDEIVEIHANVGNDEAEELVFSNNNGTDEYAKINEDGVYGKNLTYQKGGEIKNVGDEIDVIASKSSDYKDMDAIYERDFIKTNYKKDNVPYYLSNPAEQTSYDEDNYLEQKIKDVPQGGKKFIFVTDSHWGNNQKRSNYLINYVKKRLGIKRIVFGGDAVNGFSNNPDESQGAYAKFLALHELTDYGDEFFSCFGGDAIWCEGNHDANYAGFRSAIETYGQPFSDYYKYLLDDTEIFKRTIANVNNAHFDDVALTAIDELPYTSDVKANLKAFAKMTYYVDEPNDKIRYIVFDTGVNGVAQVAYMASAYGSSMHFFYDSLIRFINSCPDDYDIVVLGHMLKWDSLSDNIHPILSAFKVGAASVQMEVWNWKAANDVQIYFTETDMGIAQPSPSVGAQAYLKESSKYLLYQCSTQGVWAKTSNVLRAVNASYEALVENVPSPNVGDFAYVKTGEPYIYTKYECATAGTWSITSEVIERASNIITYGHNSPILSALLPEYTSPQFSISIGKKIGGRIFSLSGHYHADNSFICESTSNIEEGGTVSTRAYTLDSQYVQPSLRKNDAILEIITDTDSFNIGSGANGVSNPKERNTITEQCFDVVTITENNHVVCTRFGAGADRDFII